MGSADSGPVGALIAASTDAGDCDRDGMAAFAREDCGVCNAVAFDAARVVVIVTTGMRAAAYTVATASSPTSTARRGVKIDMGHSLHPRRGNRS